MADYLKEWRWSPRRKEVVVMTDYEKYRYYGGCPGQIGRRRVTRFGESVNEVVKYFKGYGWLTEAEKRTKDAKKQKAKK